MRALPSFRTFGLEKRVLVFDAAFGGWIPRATKIDVPVEPADVTPMLARQSDHMPAQQRHTPDSGVQTALAMI